MLNEPCARRGQNHLCARRPLVSMDRSGLSIYLGDRGGHSELTNLYTAPRGRGVAGPGSDLVDSQLHGLCVRPPRRTNLVLLPRL